MFHLHAILTSVQVHVRQLLQAHRHRAEQRAHPGRERRGPQGRVQQLREEDCRRRRHRTFRWYIYFGSLLFLIYKKT